MPFDRSRHDADLAALAWLVELGADEAICEQAIDRFEAPEPAQPHARPVSAPPPAPPPARASAPPTADVASPVAAAAAIAAACADLGELRDALGSFEGCALKRGARNLVFADGNPRARVMIVGEAPGRDEDAAGLPFVGRSGRLLDRMFAAIGLSREAEDPAAAVYITNVLPWRPPANRDPSADETAMMLPFLIRHIELKAPEALVLMGAVAAHALLGTTVGIKRLRGVWTERDGVPALPMLHPSALLRDPLRKREAWRDLLALRSWLDGDGGARGRS